VIITAQQVAPDGGPLLRVGHAFRICPPRYHFEQPSIGQRPPLTCDVGQIQNKETKEINMKNKILKTVLTLLTCLIIGLLVNGVAHMAYLQGIRDGKYIVGKELSSMIYLKSKSNIEFGDVDAWKMVDNYKNDKLDDFPWYFFAINGMRKDIEQSSANYDEGFTNGKSPKSAFIYREDSK